MKRYSEAPTFPSHELVLDRHLGAWGETLTLLRPSLARADEMIREHRTSCSLQSVPSAFNVPTKKLVLHGTWFHGKFGMILSLHGVFSLLHDPLGFSNQRMKTNRFLSVYVCTSSWCQSEITILMKLKDTLNIDRH